MTFFLAACFLGADETLRFCFGHGNSWVCLKSTNVLDTKNVRSDLDSVIKILGLVDFDSIPVSKLHASV